ncbi:MAG: hypothetical protein ABEJ56_02630 [Candidatus Nanohaloarchaea archaeon]
MVSGSKSGVLIFNLVIFSFLALGYTATGETGFLGQTDELSSNDPYSGLPGDPREQMFKCDDGKDGDSDGRTDYVEGSRDWGCVKPSNLDLVEGDAWDTDLTSSYLDINEEISTPALDRDPTVFFSGEVKYGADMVDEGIEDESVGSGRLRESYLKDANDESERWGLGIQRNNTYEKLPDGSVIIGDRVIDPPTDASGSLVGESKTCGDGKLNDGGMHPSDYGGGIILRDQDGGTKCPQDYGVLRMEKHERYHWNQDNEKGLKCVDDKVSTSGSCNVNWDCSNPGQKIGNTYYETIDGEETVREWKCTGDGYSEKVTDGSLGYVEGERTCDNYQVLACTGRDWDKSTQPCNDFNRVTGGGDRESGLRGEEGSKNYEEKPDNDPAATLTDYKAYATEDQGLRGKVWCQFEKTLTIDADGPKGNGDGWVVIDARNSRVIATESPNGKDLVGQNIHFRISRPGNNNVKSYQRADIEKFDFSKSCPINSQGEESRYCLKYIDYKVERKRSDWGGKNPGFNSDTISEAVVAEVAKDQRLGRRVLVPKESYSVCKKINQIAEDQGGSELLECDYERNRKDVSPLPVACGDQEKEALIAAEGTEYEEGSMREFLAFNQRCVDYSKKGGFTGNQQIGKQITKNACIFKGQVFAEGATINIGAPPKGSGKSPEQSGYSPDLEICLNIKGEGDDLPTDNRGESTSSKDLGGEWWDLDDRRVNRKIGSLNKDAPLKFFERKNRNPYHPEYNPGGSNKSIALEDDCGNKRFGGKLECDDSTGNDDFYYGFFFNPVPSDITYFK